MSEKCCINCFAHEWLREYVHEASTATGDCDYCAQEGVAVIEIEELYEPFTNLMELYVPSNDSHGEPLVDLVQWDCDVFGDDIYVSGRAAQFLEDILRTGWDDDSGESPVDAHELYCRYYSSWYHTTVVEAWAEFCDQARRDSANELKLPALFDEDLARIEAKLPQDVVLHRARIGFRSVEGGSSEAYQGTDIEAPPPEKAVPGRANTRGDVVLSIADQEATAVAEVRPWRGLLVSVAEVCPIRDLRLVDLSKPPRSSNPFTDDAPRYELEFEHLLLAFGEELGRPLRRSDDPAYYIPCQRLTRRIRDSRLYDGIRYPSAMAPQGSNIVLFNPSLARIATSRLVEVRGVGITYHPFEKE